MRLLYLHQPQGTGNNVEERQAKRMQETEDGKEFYEISAQYSHYTHDQPTFKIICRKSNSQI